MGVKRSWGDVIREFERDILPNLQRNPEYVMDYRPCTEPYSDVFVPNGLLVYMRDGSKMIYIFDPEEKDER